jgi:hypothetical protein
VLSDSVVEAVRKELRRQTSYNGEASELRRVLENDVIRADLA